MKLREMKEEKKEEEDERKTTESEADPKYQRAFFKKSEKYFFLLRDNDARERKRTREIVQQQFHPHPFFQNLQKNLKKRDGRRKEETQQCEEDPKMVQITDSIESYS